jgi:hypothetical protein
VIAVKHTKGKAARDPGKVYADALDRHQQMEAELSRAFNRWQKSRMALHRAGKRLDKVQEEADQRDQRVWAGAYDAMPFNDTL